MKTKRSTLGALALLLAAGTGLAQPRDPLRQTVEQAVNTNPEVTARRLRETQLVNAGNYTTQNTVKVAVDIQARGETPGAGACRGDSGGPVLRGNARSRDLVGIVSWSSGPLKTRARLICGGFTAITPVSEHRNWIASGSAKLLALGAGPRSEEAVQPQMNAGWSWWFTR